MEDDEICYECNGLGDDYSLDENGELKCNCPECPVWLLNQEDYEA